MNLTIRNLFEKLLPYLKRYRAINLIFMHSVQSCLTIIRINAFTKLRKILFNLLKILGRNCAPKNLSRSLRKTFFFQTGNLKNLKRTSYPIRGFDEGFLSALQIVYITEPAALSIEIYEYRRHIITLKTIGSCRTKVDVKYSKI